MMRSSAPAPCDDNLEGPDLNLALTLEQMIALLDGAAINGASEYLPLWRQLLASVGADAGLMWNGVFPSLLVGSASDAQRAERRRLTDGLYDHLQEAGFRQDLLQSLVDTTLSGGTNPTAGWETVAHATMRVVRECLANGLRLMISPENNFIEPAGWPPENHEGRAACRELAAALCCERPRAQMRAIVEQFGERTDNGWLVLRGNAPFFNKVRPAFEAWKAALAAISASGLDDEEGDAPLWAITDVAEKVIEQSAEVGRRVAEIRLWVSLQHTLSQREHCAAAAAEDLDALAAMAGSCDWPILLTLRAIAALRSAAWVAA